MADTRVKIALAACLAAGTLVLLVTLSGGPVAVARTNNPSRSSFGTIRRQVGACQIEETLPAQTTAIRLGLDSFFGPRTAVAILAHGQPIAHGEHASGWTGGAVTIPVAPLPDEWRGVDLCFTVYADSDERTQLVGEQTSRLRSAFDRFGPLPGRLGAEDLRSSGRSWFSLIPSVARRLGLGRAAAGTWNALFVLALMAGVVLLCSRQIFRNLR